MNVTIGDVSEYNPDSGQKDGNKEKQRLENSAFIDNPTQGVNTILTMNPPPPPLPGVFVFDRPKQLQQSSHHVDLTCNVNSDSYDMIQGGNVQGDVHSTSSFYPCTPTSVQSLEIGAISTSSGMCHIQSLQPVTVSSFEDSHIQSENKVYHQLNSISPNHYNLLEEPKFYHEMSPVSVTSSLPKEGYDSKEYEYLIPTTVVENPSNFCNTFQELKPLKQQRNENPNFATSKLYQQLCQPLNKEENRNQETEKAELRPLTVIELEQSSRNKTIQNTQQQYSNILGVNQSKPTYPSSPIRTEQTYSSSPIRTEQTYPSSPIRTEQTYSSSPIRTEQTYSSSPIRTEQTYPSSPIRTEQTCSSSPIRSEQTYSSSPIRTEQTYSSSPIRTEQTYSSSPSRTEYNKFQSPTRETVISKADSKLSVLSSQAKITPHTPYFQIGSSSRSQTGFKEGKIYLELRNPTIRSEILKSSAQHGHQPITPPKNKNKNLPSTLPTSFQVSPKSQKLPEFKLPGPYEFKLPQQISPNKIKLPKILGHNEYTSYESNRDPYFGNKMTSTSLLTSPSTLINKNTSFNGPRNKVALSLPKTPLCYGDPGVNSKVSQYSGSTAFVNSKSEQTVVQPTSSLDQKSLTSNDKTPPMSSHSKLLEELLKPKLSVNKSSDSHQECQNPNSSLDNRDSQIVSTQSQDSKMIQGTSKVAQNVKHRSDFSSPSKANTQKPFNQNDQSKLSPTDTKTRSVFVGRPNQSKDFKVTLSKATTVHAHEALDRLENADLGTNDSSKLPGTEIKQTENQASLETNCTSKPTFFINLSAETINTAKMSDQDNQSQYFESSKSVETINTDIMSNRCNQSQSLESSKSVETINTDIMSNRCNQSQSLESSEVASVTTSYKDSMPVCTNQLTCKPQVNVDNTNNLDIVKQKLSKHVTISVCSNSQSLTEVNKKPQSLGTSNITQATLSNQSDQVILSDKINMEGLGSRLSGNLSILSRQSVENMSARKVSSAPTAQVERICSVSSEPNNVKLNITNEKGRSLSILADLKVPMNTNVSTQATPVLIGRSCSVVMEDVLHDKKISRLVDGSVVKSLEGKASKNSSNDVISEKNLYQTLDASNISYRIEEPTSLEIKERAIDNPEEKPRKKYARRIYPESGRRKLIGRKASWGLKELIRLEKRRYKKRKVKNLDLNEGSNESLNDSKNYSDEDSSKNNSKHTAQFDKFVPQNKNVSTIKRLKKDAYYKVEELISDDEGEAVFLGFDVDDDGEMILGFASDNDDEYDMSGVQEPNHRSVQSNLLSRLNTISRLKLMFKCPKCSRIFNSQLQYKRHFKRFHLGGKIFRCNKCWKKFSSKAYLVKHVCKPEEENVSGKMYKCNTCTKGFESRRGLMTHEGSHKEKEEMDSISVKCYECDKCQHVFDSIHGLYIHEGRAHKGIRVEEKAYRLMPKRPSGKIYRCNKCRRRFKSMRAIKLHLVFAHAHKGKKCNQCEKVFTSEHTLKVHICKTRNTHEEKEETPLEFVPDQLSGKSFEFNEFDKEKECNHCQKVFKSEHALKVHKGKMKETHKEKEEIPFEFVPDQVSGKSFEFNEFHKENECNHCQKVFKSEHALKVHKGKMKETHKEKEEIPFEFVPDQVSGKSFEFNEFHKENECNHCQKVFKSEHALKVHKGKMKETHKEEEEIPFEFVPDQVSRKSFEFNEFHKENECNHCQKVFKSEHALKVHKGKMKETHKEEEEIPFEFVPDQVSRKSFEFNEFHKENECNHCQKVFKSEHALKVHKGKMKETHKEKEEIPFEFVPDQVSGKSFEFNEFHKENECNHCQKVFKSEHALKVHKGKMKETHKEKEEIPFEFVPDQVSGKSFKFNEFHKENECNHCQKVFKSEHALKVHKGKMRKTHKEKEETPFEFVPDQVFGKSCGFNKSQRLLKSELVVKILKGHVYKEKKPTTFELVSKQVSGKSYEFDKCQRSLKSDLAVKLNAEHSQEDELGILSKHMPNPISGRNYKCYKCKKIFKTRITAIIHAASVHSKKVAGNKPPIKYTDESYKCPLCFKRYRSKGFAMIHIKYVHKEEKRELDLKWQSDRSTRDKCGEDKENLNDVTKIVTITTHNGGKRYKCSKCNAGFLTNCVARKHVKEMHDTMQSKIKVHSKMPNETFDNQEAVDLAARNAKEEDRNGEDINSTKDPLYLGQEMNNTGSINQEPEINNTVENRQLEIESRSQPELQESKHKIQGETLYQCEKCLRSFQKLANLQRHKLCHKEEDINLAFPCAYCNEKFSSRDSLHAHWSVHSEKKLYTCDICQSNFSALNSLKRHKVLHSGEKLFRCEICQKAFSLLSTLKTHLLIHTGMKKFECKICGKTFNRKDVLNTHQLVHTDEKKFKCDICQQMFRWRHAVKSHKLIYHSKEKPYVCQECGKSFSHPDSFKKHAEVHADRVFSCQICSKSFSRASALRAHTLTHTDLKPFVCEKCHEKFRSRNQLRIHQAVHSREKSFLCKFCNKTFKNRKQLCRHKQKVHFHTFSPKTAPSLPVDSATVSDAQVDNHQDQTEDVDDSDISYHFISLPDENVHNLQENIVPQSLF
ncbi:uncharacterized protein LOC128994135 isoform X2 [Macrosteles quadrilineatus]|uniref:uncharacterized protein LOC128994135 isoform X2 n=1 Tax=Macrosteles quadrilineatus TaxID=74068 RepID=UPI0023E0A79E|nr:uncharacterized protein LOC128994135 isoform X2 [Macrosteles quadrilineatus]